MKEGRSAVSRAPYSSQMPCAGRRLRIGSVFSILASSAVVLCVSSASLKQRGALSLCQCVHPKSLRRQVGVVTVTYKMPPGAWCDGWYDLSTTPPGKLIKVDCWPGNSFTGAINRRLQALDYIRNNFCAGLPEPPPPPSDDPGLDVPPTLLALADEVIE